MAEPEKPREPSSAVTWKDVVKFLLIVAVIVGGCYLIWLIVLVNTIGGLML